MKHSKTVAVLGTALIALVVAIVVLNLPSDDQRAVGVERDGAATQAPAGPRDERGPSERTVVAATNTHQPPGSDHCRWSAQLVGESTGAPIAAVRVRLELVKSGRRAGAVELVSDATGRLGPVDIDLRELDGARGSARAGRACGSFERELELRGGESIDEVWSVPSPPLIRVVTLADERPLGGVRLTLSARDSAALLAEAVTSSAGRGELPAAVEITPFVLDAQLDGYCPSQRVVFFGGAEGEIDVVLELERSATVECRVSDSMRRPLSEASARLYRSETYGAPERSDRARYEFESSVWRAATESEGRVLWSAVPSGVRLSLQVELPGYVSAFVALDALTPGERRRVDIELDEAGALRVLVVDRDGNPVPGATVGLGIRPMGETDDAGACAWKRWGDAERLFVWALRSGMAFGWIEHTPAPRTSAPEVVVVTLGPENAIAGWVEDESGRRQPQVRIVPALGPPIDTNVVPAPTPGSILVSQLLARATSPGPESGSDGRFRLDGLPPGFHALRVIPPRGAPYDIDPVSTGVENLRIVLPGEGSPGPVFDVLVRERVSARAISGARVQVWYAEPDTVGEYTQKNASANKGATTDAAGRCVIAYPSAGWFWIDAQAGGYLPGETPVAHYAPGRATIVIELDVSGALEGVVRKPDGRGADGVWISLRGDNGELHTLHVIPPSGGRSTSQFLRSDKKGAFRVDALPAGPATIEVRAKHGPTAQLLHSEPIVVSANSPPLEIILRESP